MNDIPHTPGSKYYYSLIDSQQTGELMVDVGSAGENQSWSFFENDYPDGEHYFMQVMDPALTVFADSFPNAEFTWSYIFSDTEAVYNYYSIVNNQLFDFGYGVESSQGNIAFVKDEPDVIEDFPIEYQKA